ncbi:hypothetical protein [Bradyrhizobium sp. 192]|uniref:hypothetical protein n=1 Tax=Bradyrhizobium sp. 192 TaxID=2782660 RepID=UPI001FFF2767|nr:hypothetical protein [Bradyrhizobium sp. 192]UPJ59729.1 hypothetical protein IVB24_08035 [Bradyrhizobium sp. 192]
MTKIFFHGDGNSPVSAWLEAAQDQPPFNVTTFKLKFSGETGALVLGSPFLIDAMLVRDAGGSDKRLVNWKEAVEQASGEAKRLAAIALNELHDRLRSLQLKTDGTAQDGVVADFLGITGVADVATSFDLELNPAGLLGDTNSNEPVFRARATAVFSAGLDSPFAVAGLDAAVHIEVQLTRSNVLEALPRIEVPALPHLGLHFPHIPLPKWSLHALKIPFPDLPLLRLPPLPHLDIVVEWDPKPNLDFSVVGNKLTQSSTKSKATVKFSGTEILIAEDVEIAVNGNKVSITATNISTGTAEQTLAKIDLLDKANPFVVTAFGVKVSATASFSQIAGLTVVVTIKVERLVISASTDSNLVLAVSPELELTFAGDKLTPKLTKLDLVEPYPIKLALFAAHVIEDGAERLMSLIHKFEVPKQDLPGTPDLPSLDGFLKVLRRVGELAASAAAWLAQQGAAGVRALAGLAEAAFKMIAELVSTLAEAIAKEAQTVAKYIVVEVRVDLGQWRIVQIVVTPSDPGASLKSFTREFLGFKLDFPYNLSPALVCDLDKGWLALALQPESAGSSKVTLSTDLWLGHENGPAEPVSGQTNGTADAPLMKLDVTPKDPKAAVALIVVDNGRVKFLQQLKTVPVSAQLPGQGPNGGVVVPVGHLLLAARWVELTNLDASAFDIDAKIDPDRILSLFRKPKADATPGGNLLDQFSQHVRVKASNKPVINLPTIRIPIDVEVKISDTAVDTKLDLVIDVYTLAMAIKGGKFEIKIDKNEINLLGLHGTFLTKDGGDPPVDFAPLFLDFSDGDPRLGLSEAAKIKLSYDKLSTSGSTLDFEVDSFIVSRDGIDLSAQVQSNPVTLAGVDMPFRFDKGQLAVKRSQIQTFGLAGHGNLPPALVGEAKASIELNFTQENGALALQAAKAVLDKSGDPLRCEGTQFTITVTKLGLKYVRQGQYHFYFTLTGSAEFRPSSNAFADGLLKNISALRIVLDEAPLASDPRVLMNHIEFQVTVEPPKRSTFFDLFSFELRGVGFHPASPAFGGTPAFSISGQVNFTDFGDIVTPRFDFHKLWVAPPERGKALPRVRFDGLGVGLSLGSMAEASGTAIAVDGKLPTLFQPDVLPADVTAKGFLASGSLRISGWASMSASMGFLQLEKKGVDEKRPAFFLYVQRNDMAEKIPTPIGTIYLREVGFGFGYRYTLAGIAAAERAETPKELVKILDEISKYQGSLYDVKAWWPTYDNSAITLALRGMFSFTSVSTTSKYNEQGEKNLPNLALFDIVVALRTDLTFLLNLRIWIAYNYADWRDGRRNNSAWTNNPSLTGYMYLSVPRREFLARAVYNPGAEIGDHPMLPAELKMAMKAVKWSSTLYIRPGLFHAEYGWPYELGFSVGKPNGNFFLSVEGGTVLRIEDLSVLYGLAFRARGFAAFAYDTGGDFGAAITARANFALGAKLIAYLSANISESMFYGVITLDLSLEFSVRMWLRTKWFSLSCGFSRSITIHIGVELLIEPGGLAARIEASVSVGAFGRNLSLGIGFSLGSSGRLAEARVRVERFLALGLATSYPNPEAGAPVSRPAPLPEPSRADNARKAETRLDEGVDRREATSSTEKPVPGSETLEFVGVEFGPVSYWALLVPIPRSDGASPESYVVQLIPRDNCPLAKGEASDRSHFYAAPMEKEDEATYVLQGMAKKDALLRNGMRCDEVGTALHVWTDWDAPFGRDGDSAGFSAEDSKNARQNAKLKEIFQHCCFMVAGKIGGVDYEATDIKSVQWEDDPVLLPEDAEAANIMIAQAARSRADCGPRFKRMQQVDEARSSFIATVAEAAEQIAALVTFRAGIAELNKDAEDYIASKLEFDLRALGLTFVLRGDRVEELFDTKTKSSDSPITSETFTIRTRIPRQPGPSIDPPPPGVVLFNPPDRMFRIMSPVLDQPELEITTKGVRATWDLEPAWKKPSPLEKSLYSDPEFHLKHYRVERRIEGLADHPLLKQRPAPLELTIKPSDHTAIVVLKDKDGNPDRDADGNLQLRKRRLREAKPLQFVDDFKDIDPGLRAALLPPVLLNNGDEAKQAAKWKDVVDPDTTRIIYAIVPVDCAGTRGQVDTHVVAFERRKEIPNNLLKAIARFSYPSMPSVLNTPVLSGTFLALTVEEEETPTEASKTDENSKPELSPARNYVFRVRTERTVPVGVFGADAVSQARNEPPVPDRLEPGADELDVVLQTGAGAGKKIRVNRIARRLRARTTPGPLPEPATETIDYRISDGDWKKLLARLEVVVDDPANVARLQAARIYLRFDGTEPRSPAWVPAQLQLMIDDPQAKPEEEPPVNVTIERFEHPVDVKFRPFKSNFIFPASGRLHLYYPTADATIDSFVASNADTVRLLCDGDQRTAVKLAWTARPDEMTVQGDEQGRLKASDLHTLIAGYDLFSLDATTVPKNDEGADASLRLVKPIGRVQRQPALERGQEPSETGDFARVEVLYPSEMQRLTDPALDRRFGKRRTSWYSPAESFLVWPTRPLRRSLLTLPEENDIAALFARRQPLAIRVEWTKAKPGGPELPTLPTTFGFASETPGTGPASLHDGKLSAGLLGGDDNKPLTVDQARRLLRGLVLMESPEVKAKDQEAYANPDGFSNRVLKLTSLYNDPNDNSDPSTVTVNVSLATPQHPILADVLDVVQYHYEGIEYRGKQLVYRRYEPVVDPAPQLNAEEILAFLDETAPDRDPAGWGILRTLGLATAFRLYDIETGNFLESGEALKRLNVALKLVLPRYQGTQFGAPFVDVMFTTDGLSEVVSHFGTAPSDETAAKQLCQNKALALVQLELRPAVQPLLGLDGQLKKRRVRYATLRLAKATETVSIQPAKSGDRIVIELEPLVPTDGSSQRRVLMAQGWKNEKQFPIEGEPISNKLTLRTAGMNPDDALAYVRLVALDDATDLSELGALTLPSDVKLDPSDTPKEDDGTQKGSSPWGRFANLPDSWLAALMFGDNIQIDPKIDPTLPDPERSAPFNTVATLIRILGHFPNKPNMKIPKEPKKRLQIAAQLGSWTRRFMEQGSAKPATSQAGLAFAMLTRPNPWRLAPDSDGRLSVTLLETDRWGKARKYAVRPFGRYENLAIGAETTVENRKSEANQPAKTAMAVQDFAASLPKPIDADVALRQFFADVSIERTEGLAAPVILATRRNNRADKGGVVRPGDSVQIVVSRHPEEILSDANIRVDAGLSMRHVAVGFWREFSAPQWAKLVQKSSGDPEFDLLEPFGPFKDNGRDYSRLPVPKGLSIIEESKRDDYQNIEPKDVDIGIIREMYERHPDLWRGAYVLNMSAMPYGFRLHATAHVAAGVVVSPPSVATVDEAGYRLVLPWKAGVDGAVAWQDKKVMPPSWRIDRPTSDDKKVKVVVEWPMVRIVDGMFEDALKIWFGKNDAGLSKDTAPRLYQMPDPAVSYRISVETDDGQVRVGEIELGALSSDPDGKPRDLLYLPQLIGARFDKPDLKAPSGQAVNGTHYPASLTLEVKGDPDAKKPLGKFAPAALDPAFVPADLLLAAANTAPWGDVAPGTSNEEIDATLDLTITPPLNVPDPLPPPLPPPPAPQWTAFRQDVEAFVKEMRTYETTASASPRFAKIAKEIADAVEPFAIDKAAEWKAKTGVLLPHTVKVHWVAGLPVDKFPSITLGPIAWRWFAAPEKTGTINGAAREKIKAVLDAAIAAAAGNAGRVKLLEELRRTVLNAMRARMIALRRDSDEQPKHNLVPLRSNLPADININLDELRKLSETSPVDFVATVHLPENAARTADEIEAAFTALEDKANAADTLESLAAMMDRPGEAADIAMRWSSRKAVEPELDKLHPESPLAPKTMILIEPATKDEIAELKPAHASLPALAGDLTQTMVLGPRRHLVIQAFHGLAQPQDDVVQREH